MKAPGRRRLSGLVALVLALGCAGGGQQVAPEAGSRPDWPRTCEAAAGVALGMLTPESRAKVRATPRDELVVFYRSWGRAIRDQMGITRGNAPLVASCVGRDASSSEVSMAIMRRAWEQLQ